MSTKQKDLIYETKWDILIILDACRCDSFFNVAYPILKQHKFNIIEAKCVISEDTCTLEWFAKTFNKPLKDVVYLSNNPLIGLNLIVSPVSKISVDPKQIFASIIEVHKWSWREVGFFYTYHPEELNKLALAYILSKSSIRLILHYLQPHCPYPFNLKFVKWFRESDIAFWEAVRRGEISIEEVKKGYEQNLKFVLNYVIDLIKSTKNKTIVITSDHGEAFGENNAYNHPCCTYIKELILVPWVVIKT